VFWGPVEEEHCVIDMWKWLGTQTSIRVPTSSESRADDYIDLGTPEFGLKARGGKKLELKTRVETTPKGSERWTKTHLKDLRVLEGDLESKLRRRLRGMKKLCKLLDGVTVSDNVLRLQKERETCHVKLRGHEMHVEQVKLVCCTYTKTNETVQRRAYRSVCAEGDKEDIAALMTAFVEENFREQGLQCWVMGYPEWLSTIRKTLETASVVEKEGV